MNYYPINLDMTDKKAVVIGGGKIAARKIAGLLEAGAKITVVSPDLTSSLMDHVDRGEIQWKNKRFSSEDIIDAFLIIAATNDPEFNLSVKEATYPNQLLSIVSDPEESNFILPAVVKQGKLIISVSTSGASPILAKKIKQDISETYGPNYKEYVDFLASCRKRILEEISEPKMKQALLTEITNITFLHSTTRELDFNQLMNHYLNKNCH